ncbi:hypothetical protein C8Q74DRAFT_1300601 [Fomes fomentarius]|nr:hypothetical protein C8Q74DRAFT_1300601 [Fomes fomentarius]
MSFPPPPPPSHGADAEAVILLSTLPEYQIFGPLFDGVFLLAAGVSARSCGVLVTG